MDNLVKRLTEREHAVEVSLRPEPSMQLFRDAVDRSYVHILFTETKGGTELGVELDPDASDFSAADFDAGTGTAHVEGNLVLNFEPVRCVADIDLSTLKGTGRLHLRDEARESGAAA